MSTEKEDIKFLESEIERIFAIDSLLPKRRPSPLLVEFNALWKRQGVLYRKINRRLKDCYLKAGKKRV